MKTHRGRAKPSRVKQNAMKRIRSRQGKQYSISGGSYNNKGQQK